MVYPHLSWKHSWNQRWCLTPNRKHACRSAWGKRWCSTYTAGKAFQDLKLGWKWLRKPRWFFGWDLDSARYPPTQRRPPQKTSGSTPNVDLQHCDPDPKHKSNSCKEDRCSFCKDLWIFLWIFFSRHSEPPTCVVVASAEGLGFHTPRRSRCLWPLDHQKSLLPGNQIQEGLDVGLDGKEIGPVFVRVSEYQTACLLEDPPKYTLSVRSLVLQIPSWSQIDFWREPTTADSLRATILHAPATLHTCFFQESLRKRMNQRGLQIKKSSWMFKTWHGLNLEVRNDQVDPPFMKHVPHLFVVASWVLKKTRKNLWPSKDHIRSATRSLLQKKDLPPGSAHKKH